MRVLLLGTSGYHPTDRRQTACVLLPELGISLDAGTGMFRVGRHLPGDSLDIFLSHAHLDHVIGLTFFFTLLAEKPLSRITVHGEAAKLQAIQQHLFADALFPAQPSFEWQVLKDRTCLSNGAVLHHFPLEHPGDSVGYRLEYQGRSLAYVTDVTASPEAAYVQQIQDVDLLLHECNFPDGAEEMARRTGHSCLLQVARVAAAARVKKLVLLHFDPFVEIPEQQLHTAREVFPGLIIGEDNMALCVGSTNS